MRFLRLLYAWAMPKHLRMFERRQREWFDMVHQTKSSQDPCKKKPRQGPLYALFLFPLPLINRCSSKQAKGSNPVPATSHPGAFDGTNGQRPTNLLHRSGSPSPSVDRAPRTDPSDSWVQVTTPHVPDVPKVGRVRFFAAPSVTDITP